VFLRDWLVTLYIVMFVPGRRNMRTVVVFRYVV
jgi:hypothetical protein